ncbi:MAG: hypothetical protein J5747_00705 [Spirochaetaceae bacterium]|nr:hypothetical protein [Spirochaetaceae bacterium]
MNNTRFVFHSTRLYGAKEFFNINIPSIVSGIWALLIFCKLALSGRILLLVLFICVYYLLMVFVWPEIWKPWLECDQDKKTIRLKFPQLMLLMWHAFPSLRKVLKEEVVECEIMKLISIKKEKLEDKIETVTKKQIFKFLGKVLFIVFYSIFYGFLISIAGFLRFVIVLYVLFAAYQFWEGMLSLIKNKTRNYVEYTFKYKDDSNTKDSDKSNDDKNAPDFCIDLENQNDIQPFESYLKDCLSSCDRNDLSIEEVSKEA